MGMMQSMFCSIAFCIERVLTWTCCAFLLMLLMFVLVILMVYGISVGYHYAQTELASFAVSTRFSMDDMPARRSDPESNQPVVRLVAVNRTDVEPASRPVLELYQTKKPDEQIIMENTQTPIVLLETERPPQKPKLAPHEREFAKRLIGRFRRSKNTTTDAPFLRPLRQTIGLS